MFTLQGMRGNVELITETRGNRGSSGEIQRGRQEILSDMRRFPDSKRFIQGTGTAGS